MKTSEEVKDKIIEIQEKICECGHNRAEHDRFENQCQGEDYENSCGQYFPCHCKKFQQKSQNHIPINRNIVENQSQKQSRRRHAENVQLIPSDTLNQALIEKSWSIQKFEKIDWKKRERILFMNDVIDIVEKALEEKDKKFKEMIEEEYKLDPQGLYCKLLQKLEEKE